jgi:hypothetical protein
MVGQAVVPDDPEPGETGFDLRFVHAYPRLTLGALYTDNVVPGGTNRLKDFFLTASPRLSLTTKRIGDLDPYLLLDYIPTYYKYLEYNEFSHLDHVARIAAFVPFSRLTLGIEQQYSKTETAVALDIGSRIQSTIYRTIALSRYEISTKTSVEVNGRYDFGKYEGLREIKEISNDNWFNYHWGEKLTTSAGLGIGHVESTGNADQVYQTLQARAIYQLTGKLGANIAGGMERREYSGSSEAAFSPIFSAGIEYAIREGTSLSLNGYSRVQPSVSIAGQNFHVVGSSISVRQLLLSNTALSVAGGFDTSEYQSTTTLAATGRSDQIWFGRIGLDQSFSARWSGHIYFEHRSVRSSVGGNLTYDNNQIALQTAWQF